MKLMIAFVPNTELEKELLKELVIFKRMDQKQLDQLTKDEYLKLEFPASECKTGFEFMAFIESKLPNLFIKYEEPLNPNG